MSIEEEALAKRKSFARTLEPFARKYIEYENGMERVKATLTKDINREWSPELKRLIWQTKTIAMMAFGLKLIPTWRQEEERFKRDYRGTVFQTVKDAHQQMRIQVMSNTTRICIRYTIPVTLFCGAILGISQFIQIYNNKTTAFDYVAALGITGGLSRLHYGGVRGLIAGAVLGSAFGLVVGPAISYLMHYSDDTFEQRHLWEVCERLAVEHSIIGDKEFKYSMSRLMEGEKVDLMTERVQA